MSDKKILLVLLILLVLPFVYSEASFTFYSGADVGPVCPRATGLYTDVIQNNGDEALKFSVTNSGSAAVFATTVPTGFTLFPGQIKNIYTYVTPMSSVDIGNYVLNLKASANGLTQEIRHDVSLIDCYDYSLEANTQKVNACPCESDRFSFTLTNNGEYTETYSLGVDGEYKANVVLSQNSLTLAPGESKEILAYVEAGCEDEGDYDFSVVVNPSRGRQIKSQTVTFVVDACYDFGVGTDTSLINMCEHSTENIAINVENQGSTSNIYTLDVDGPAWANLDANTLNIGPGAIKTINLQLIPDYGVEGNFEVTFTAVPEKGSLKAVKTFDVNVKKCYDVSVDIEKNSDRICNDLENTYAVTVRNQGEFANEFFVDLEGPSWATLDANSLSLGAGEEKQINLNINPTFDVSAGEYTITVSVSAKDSNNIADSDTITIETVSREDCYDAFLDIKEDRVKVYYDSSATVPVLVENRGAKSTNYELSVSGTAASFVYLNPSVVEVAPGDSEVVYLYIAPSSQVSEGDYGAGVTISLQDGTVMESDSVNIEITGNPDDSGLTDITGQTPAETESGTSIFSKIINWIAGLFGGGSEETAEEEETPEINETEETPEEAEEEIEETPEEVIEEEINETEETPDETEIQEETEEFVPTPENVLLGIGDSTKFDFEGEEHTITVDTRSGDMVLLKIMSDPVFVPLNIGEVKNVDLDHDGYYDLKISFSGFVGDEADITYTVLNPGVVNEGQTGEETTGEETTSEEGQGFFGSFFSSLGSIFTGIGSGIANYWIQLVVLVIIIVLIILLAKTNLWGKVTKFFEEEIEEEPVVAPAEKPKEEKIVKEEKKVEVKEEVKKETKKKEVKKKEEPKKEEPKPEEEEEDEFVIEFDDDD